MKPCINSRVMGWPRVKSFSWSYGLGRPWRRITVCTGSASTSQAASRSAALGYALLACDSLSRGMDKLEVNPAAIAADLDAAWEVQIGRAHV